MSLCSSLRGRRVSTLGPLLVAAALMQPVVATADRSASVIRIVAPVIDLVAPAVPIEFGEADAQGEAKVERSPKSTRITLDSTILFAKDTARINAKARGRLLQVGDLLRQRGPGSVSITGYTDDLGSAAHGLILSRQRARAVAAVLRRRLPASDAYTVTGLGEAHPAAPNRSEANRRTNRRVGILYQSVGSG